MTKVSKKSQTKQSSKAGVIVSADIKSKILIFLGIEFVIQVEPHFENQRIIQRGKKQVLQKLRLGSWCYDDYWEDICTIENES
jgi:hypothetical protein